MKVVCDLQIFNVQTYHVFTQFLKGWLADNMMRKLEAYSWIDYIVN